MMATVLLEMIQVVVISSRLKRISLDLYGEVGDLIAKSDKCKSAMAAFPSVPATIAFISTQRTGTFAREQEPAIRQTPRQATQGPKEES